MSIEITGLNELLSKLTRLEQLRRVQHALRAAALHVKGKIATYPPESHRPQPFQNDADRRSFFAKLRAGEIEVPYRRGVSPGSQKLGSRWTIAASDSGMTQTIGNNTSYGPQVQGPGQQIAYHAETGWKTTSTVAREEEALVVDYIRQAVIDELR